MLELDANPSLRRLFQVARRRVVVGFLVAAAAFALARPSRWSLAVGVPVAVIGEAIRVWAAGHLMKGREVTTSGPYAWTRHPLYVGSAFLGVGFVIIAASPLVAVVVLGYLAVTIAVAIRLEEATLRATFGDTHAQYVDGSAAPSNRRFSLRRALNNREHHALAGFAGVVALMTWLAW